MRYVYPAVFVPEDGLYNVTFPDLPDCYTSGEDLTDAMFMAQDILADVLSDKEEQNESVPNPSDLSALTVPTGCTAVLVTADTDAWRHAHSGKAVKKTLTIPQWLDTAAQVRGINFSQVLQDALRTQLGV